MGQGRVDRAHHFAPTPQRTLVRLNPRPAAAAVAVPFQQHKHTLDLVLAGCRNVCVVGVGGGQLCQVVDTRQCSLAAATPPSPTHPARTCEGRGAGHVEDGTVGHVVGVYAGVELGQDAHLRPRGAACVSVGGCKRWDTAARGKRNPSRPGLACQPLAISTW